VSTCQPDETFHRKERCRVFCITDSL